MFDLLALALQTDTTRVFTFKLGREESVRTYPEIGISEAHHPLSHHGGDPVKLQKAHVLNKYHMSLFAHFLDKLQSTAEPEAAQGSSTAAMTVITTTRNLLRDDSKAPASLA